MLHIHSLLFKSRAELLSYLQVPRPFKNPYYVKNANRRTKGIKFVLAAEREKMRLAEKIRQERKDRETREEDEGVTLTCK